VAKKKKLKKSDDEKEIESKSWWIEVKKDY
jgi:hypothetical protein